ncbi:hypothetical protein J6590_000251 [Homalodisca vitripennis]|nr:hypothetical protein J6590_000251 [Homalodisca vitripennis]
MTVVEAIDGLKIQEQWPMLSMDCRYKKWLTLSMDCRYKNIGGHYRWTVQEHWWTLSMDCRYENGGGRYRWTVYTITVVEAINGLKIQEQ